MRYPDPWPDFLAKYAQFETLTAKNAYSILKKHKWRSKRSLGPKPKRRRGGQAGNGNALKHGYYGGEQQAVWAMFRAFLRAMDDERQASKRRSRRPRSAARECL